MDSNSITESIKGLWVERYRPKTLADIILPARTREIIEGFNHEIPNLLFGVRPKKANSYRQVGYLLITVFICKCKFKINVWTHITVLLS